MTVSPIALRDAAYKHAEDLKKLRGSSAATCKQYHATYNTLARHLEPKLGREPMASDLSLEVLEDYFGNVVSTQAPQTWAMRRAYWIQIVAWLMKRGYLEWGQNFAEEIPARRVTTARPRQRRLSDSEFLKLLQSAMRSHLRDYYLCLFMRLSGRRISEVTGVYKSAEGMLWGDVRWEEGVIQWDNHKARRMGNLMPLTPRLRAVLEAWKDAYCKDLGVAEPRNDWQIFPALTAIGVARKGHKRKRALSPKFQITNPDRIIHALLEDAGLWTGQGDGWHIMRKTFGNQRKQAASDQGRGDAWEMAKVSLDHKDEAATRLYVNAREDYERYAAWAMETPELGDDAMKAIPELAALVPASRPPADTQKAATSVSVIDAQQAAEVDTLDENSSVVSLAAFARRRRALG